MKTLLIKALLRILFKLGYQELTKTEVSKPVEAKQKDNLTDVWFRAVALCGELKRNKLGYEPEGWDREQLVYKLEQEYPWLSGEDLTKIINGVML